MIVIWCQFINISFLLLSISVLRNVPSRLLLQRSKASPAVSYPVTGQDLIRYAQTGMPVQILADLLRIGHRDTPELRRLCGLFTRDQPDRYQVSAFSGLLEGKEIWKKKLIHILSFLYNSVNYSVLPESCMNFHHYLLDTSMIWCLFVALVVWSFMVQYKTLDW